MVSGFSIFSSRTIQRGATKLTSMIHPSWSEESGPISDPLVLGFDSSSGQVYLNSLFTIGKAPLNY